MRTLIVKTEGDCFAVLHRRAECSAWQERGGSEPLRSHFLLARPEAARPGTACTKTGNTPGRRQLAAAAAAGRSCTAVPHPPTTQAAAGSASGVARYDYGHRKCSHFIREYKRI